MINSHLSSYIMGNKEVFPSIKHLLKLQVNFQNHNHQTLQEGKSSEALIIGADRLKNVRKIQYHLYFAFLHSI